MSDLLTFSQAAAELPGRPHITTLHRWRQRGVKAGDQWIKLRTVRVGGRRLVERAAIEEFIAATTAAADGGQQPVESHTTREREAAIAKAEARLAELGI
jgi:hypothetical protein